MKDLMLNSSGDLLLTEGGDVAFTNSVLQAIYIRLKWFNNEWALSPSFGLPYYEEFLKKNPSSLLLEQYIKEAVLSVDGVDDVEKVSVDIIPGSRTLNVQFTAITGKALQEGRFALNV